VLYCGKLPHALFLTGYQGDIFYCADTVQGISGRQIPLKSSWLGVKYGSQAAILKNVTAYWYVSDYIKNGQNLTCQCSSQYAGTYVVNSTSVDLRIRAGHGTNFAVLGTLPHGTKVTVLKASGMGANDWAHITYNGINGFVSVAYLKQVACEHLYGAWTDSSVAGEETRTCSLCGHTETRQAEVGQMGTITGSQLRIRSGAGTGYGVVGFLDKGDRVEILEIMDVGSEVWGRISQGWISMRYVKLDDPAGEEPPVTEPPVTEPPVTEPPVTEPPVTEPPVTEPPAVETGRLGTVTASCLCVRSGAGTGNSVVGYLYYGARVEILEQKTVGGMTWGRTAQGWISMSYVELDPVEDTPAQPRMVMVNTGCLRIRAEATTNSEIVGYLYWGAQVEILETKDVDGMTWGRTSQGWISMDYVEEI
jgi:uncharacterized protein YgiM (DUF1202 family)